MRLEVDMVLYVLDKEKKRDISSVSQSEKSKLTD
jgi:hypothetical protein